jgi:hypothetical protein
MILIAAVVALVGQFDPVLPSAEPLPSASTTPALRVTKDVVVGRLMDPAKRAEAACRFVAASDEIVCSAAELSHFNVVQLSRTDAPAGLEVRAQLAPSPRDQAGKLVAPGCAQAAAVVISLRHPTEQITVDWQRTTLDVDGVARQLLPGFARKATAALVQRPSSAAAGVLLTEAVYIDGDSCLTSLSPLARSTVVGLQLAVRIGNVDDRVDLRQSLGWEALTPEEALLLLPIPPDLPPPDEPAPIAAVGGGVGGVVGLALGGAAAAANFQQARDLGESIRVGVCGGLLFGGLCGAGTFAAIWLGGEESARKRYDADATQHRYRAALVQKRLQLGAPPTSTDPSYEELR